MEKRVKIALYKQFSPLKRVILVLCSFTIILSYGCGEKKKKSVPKSIISLRSIPDKVNIKLISHNIELGTTPWKKELPPATLVFEFTKPGYQTTWEKVTCTPGSRHDIEVKMKPKTASVIIETEQPGVTLFSGERQIGETPIALHNLALGTHTYTLKKPGYATKEITVNLEDDRPVLVNTNMNSNIGTLVLKSTPTNANVFVDGKPRGKTPATISLERGEHDLEVKLTGYATHQERFVITRDKTSNLDVTLQELPGSIKVVTTPPGSTLKVNGKQYNNTPTTLEKLPPGTYKIEVSHDKYDSSTRTVSLAAGQKLTIDIKLDTNMGGIDLTVHPPGVTIYVDGVKLGCTQQGETKDLSNVFEIRNLKSGIHTITLAHKRAVPTIIKRKVVIKKGEIKRPAPIRLWVKDTYLKLNDGKEFTGRIAQETDEAILFEPDPTMKIKYDRKDIKTLRPLREEE